MEGKYRGKVGPIKHIFRYFLFVQVTDRVENGGIIVVRGNQCSAVGQRSDNSHMIPMSPGTALMRGGQQVCEE